MILGGGGDEALARPLADLSTDDIAALFLSAAKPDTQWYVGIELELLPYMQSSLRPPPHEALATVLANMGENTGMRPTYEPTGALTGLEGNGELVSLEPGGQLEFATRPHRSLKAAREEVLQFATALRAASLPEGLDFWALGQQPFVNRDTAPHMPKPRYDHMRRYLGARGARALDMMHLTGSVQCTVDFQSEQNLVDKVRTAARVSPFLSALVAASPFSGGKANGFQSVRYQIWLETDDERCGIWPEMLDDEGFRMHRYVQRTLRAPPMFFMRGGQYVAAGDKAFGTYVKEGFEGTPVTVSDYLDHLTTFFPEIRTKAYVELRGADCVKPVEAVAIAGFWRGLLDEENTRQAVEARLAAMDFEAVRALQPQIAKVGLDASSPAGPVREVVKWLVDTAYQRLDKSAPDCAECVMPLVERADRGQSPSDEMLAKAKIGGIEAALDIVRCNPEA